MLLLLNLFGLFCFIAIKAFDNTFVNFFDYIFFQDALHLHEVILVVLAELDGLLVSLAKTTRLRVIVCFGLDLAVDRVIGQIIMVTKANRLVIVLCCLWVLL